MIDFKDKRILVLSPHTDDAELGCGGTIARAIEEGAEVYVLALSNCKDGKLGDEFYKSVKELGVTPEMRACGHESHRDFPEKRQEILDTFIAILEIQEYDIVFCPSLNDIHQDHKTVAQEAVRAFKRSTILAYEMPWNNLNFNTAVFVKLRYSHIMAKMNALACYKSQDHRDYMSREATQAQATMRGVQIGSSYAEVFELIRLVI